MRPFLLCALLAGCGGDALPEQRQPLALEPYVNPFTEGQPGWSPQPDRLKPQEVLVTGDKVYVSLPGTPDTPGQELAVVDAVSHRLMTRIEVGAGPVGMALHPSGRLLVFNRYSNFASVIDVVRDEVVQRPPFEFYAVEGAFTPDGERLVVSNRWKDALLIYAVDARSGGLDLGEPRSVEVGSNPRDLAVSEDGKWAAVGALTGMTVSIVDIARAKERSRIAVGGPVNGLAIAGDILIVATTSASTHHRALEGPDTDGDGVPGDGTPNVNFQDLQNEIAVYRLPDGAPLHRYTSDSICCRDYRDVDPGDEARGGDLLPDSETWIVGGALPEQVLVRDDEVWITYSGSNEVQRFTLDDETGALSPGPVWPTQGHNPHGIALAGETLVVTHRLSETLGFYARDGSPVAEVALGDGPAFPATDAELGELFNFVTAPFTVDGDQTCAHCHREGGNIDKAFSMPLTRYGGVGMRMTMAYRGAADTRPWFFEAAMDESNFKPVMNEFARIENFCCTDYTLFPQGAPSGCSKDPPAACAEPNAGSSDGFDAQRIEGPYTHARPHAAATRDLLFREVAEAMTGRTESFGDGLFFEDPISGERQPVPLDFDGMTRALGLFLMTAPRLLPNPNPGDDASARRGRALFESPSTGCSTCHPAPSFALSTDVNPLDAPLRMGPVVTPTRDADGLNLDLFAEGFAATFPKAEMDGCEAVCGAEACAENPNGCDDLREVRFGVPSLRGLWDRAPSLLHDGRAKGLREALCTPGHPALDPGQTGFNERDGLPDTHGGTSHLSREAILDLEHYLRSL